MDPRIKVARRDTNGHISAASNTALSMATGEWVGCLDHDDILADHALALVGLRAGRAPRGGDRSTATRTSSTAAGVRQDPYFKPDFDPLLLIGQNYLNHLCLFRRDLVTEVGGYREGYEGSQDWDLALRVSELLTPEQTWFTFPMCCTTGGPMPVRRRLWCRPSPMRSMPADERWWTTSPEIGRPGLVSTRIPSSGYNRVTWDLPDPAPGVSIIIPTRDGTLLQRCIDSVFAFTTYPNFEIIVVDNSSRTLPTLAYLRANDDRVKVIRDERPFNYSAINNAAVRQYLGRDRLPLERRHRGHRRRLADRVGRTRRATRGGRRRVPSSTTTTAASNTPGSSSASSAWPGIPTGCSTACRRVTSGGSNWRSTSRRVTAACMVVRREAWDQVGGLDEQNLPIAFNDVDFGLRLREAGLGHRLEPVRGAVPPRVGQSWA